MKIDLKNPGFGLETEQGPVNLQEQMGTNGLLIYFMREFACMTCQGHVSKLVQNFGKLQASGLNVLVIGGGKASEAQKLTKRFNAPFTIAADPNRAAYHLFELDKAMGFWQKSGSFIVQPDGVVSYELRSTKPGGLNLDEITEAMEHVPTPIA